MSPGVTPSQTVGPFFAIGLPWPDGPFVVPEGAPGAVWLRGRVLDGAGDPVPDALVESWQADPDGRFAHPDDPRGGVEWDERFRGFGRSPTDEAGRWAILTVKPGPVPGPGGEPQAPHVDLSVFARGMLNRGVTRLYFGDEPEANAADPVLSGLTERQRATLVAQASEDGYRLDVHLQGAGETTFFIL
jgi:protocatechuate 3,4-dioxygenase, alpha subunit